MHSHAPLTVIPEVKIRKELLQKRKTLDRPQMGLEKLEHTCIKSIGALLVKVLNNQTRPSSEFFFVQ